ncbi:hypothetical protein AHAS_Ahas09G0155200 [Arachis hypogaea]
MTLRMHRRDKRMKGGRPRKKEEALFALLRPVAVRGVTVVAAVRGCVTEPLSLENSAASLGSTSCRCVSSLRKSTTGASGSRYHLR